MIIIKKHFSLIIMGTGAAAQLLSSLFLYKLMDPMQYGLYALFITYISIAFSFGLLGAEQTFMRNCTVKEGIVFLNKKLMILLVICFFVGPAILAVTSSTFFMKEFSGFKLYLVAILVALVMFGYNYQRILGKFINSQIINNFWRITVLSVTLWGMLFSTNFSFEFIFISVSVGLFISASFFIGRLIIQRPIEILDFDKNEKSVFKLFLSFLFSMGVLTVLNFFDRYLVGAKFGVEQFGDFFLLQNVFVYPFVLIANYFGFKGLVEYKKNFNLNLFNRRIFLLSIISPLIGLIYMALVLLVDSFVPFTFGFFNYIEVIVPLVFFGCIKLVYSTLSAAMGARGHALDIFLANLVSIVFVVISAWGLMQVEVTIEIIAWVMVFLWLLRCISYYVGVYRCAQ